LHSRPLAVEAGGVLTVPVLRREAVALRRELLDLIGQPTSEDVLHRLDGVDGELRRLDGARAHSNSSCVPVDAGPSRPGTRRRVARADQTLQVPREAVAPFA